MTRFDRFEAPYASMVHDFIVTENHLLFPVLPITGSMARAMGGQPAYAWEPEKGAHVGVMKRNGSAKDIVWFRGESCYVFHVMNAWEDGSRIIADVMQFEEAPLFPHPDGRPTDPKKSRARYCRWTFDLAGNTDSFTQVYLDDLTGEFPRVDDRRAGPKSSARLVRLRQSGPAVHRRRSQGIVHVDGDGKRLGKYHLPAGDTISEPVFVERTKDAAEGDGWLLAVVWRAREQHQRSRGVQCDRCRGRPGGAGASRPSRAGWLPRQLGGSELTLFPSSFRDIATSSCPGMTSLRCL